MQLQSSAASRRPRKWKKIVVIAVALVLGMTLVFGMIPPRYSANAALDAPKFDVDRQNAKDVLSWDPVNGATSYRIYRKNGIGGQYELLGSTEDTTYTDVFHNTVKNSQEISLFKDKEHWYIDPVRNPYIYTVEAVRTSFTGETIHSSYDGHGLLKLEKPTMLSVNERSDGKTAISWKTVANAQKYVLLMGSRSSKTGKISWMKVGEVPAQNNVLQNATISQKKGYHTYAVQAVAVMDGKTVQSSYDAEMRTDARNHKKSRILFLGDSIVYGEPYTKVTGYSVSFPHRVGQKTGASVYDAGISGATIATGVKGLYSITKDEAWNIYYGRTPNHPKSSGMKTLPYSLDQFDIVVVEGGANDYSFGVPLGKKGGDDTTTFYGAYRNLMRTLSNASKKRIKAGKKPTQVVIVDLFYSAKHNKQPDQPLSRYSQKNKLGLTYQDYSNAINAEASAWSKSKTLKVHVFHPSQYKFVTEANCPRVTVDNLHMSSNTYASIGNNLTGFFRREVW